MTAIVLLSDGARHVLQQLPPQTRRRLKAALTQLATDPSGRKADLDVRLLTVPPGTPPTHRLAVGSFRIAFRLHGRRLDILRIFHRSQGYAWLE